MRNTTRSTSPVIGDTVQLTDSWLERHAYTSLMWLWVGVLDEVRPGNPTRARIRWTAAHDEGPRGDLSGTTGWVPLSAVELAR